MAAQVRVDMTKQSLQAAAKQALSNQEQAEEAYNKEKEFGMTGDNTFDQWWPANYPAFAAARQQYQAARAAYEAALANVGQQEYQAWREIIQQKALENPLPDGRPNYDLIISPDE